MPLYEYECQSCHRRFERIRKFADPPLEACPECGGRVEKLLSTPAFQFKGSGWYVTDYARKGEASETSTEGKEGGAPAAAEAKEKKDGGAAASAESKEGAGAATKETKDSTGGKDAGGSKPGASESKAT